MDKDKQEEEVKNLDIHANASGDKPSGGDDEELDVEAIYRRKKAEQEAEDRLEAEKQGKTLKQYQKEQNLLRGDRLYAGIQSKDPRRAYLYARAKIDTYNLLCRIFGDPDNDKKTKPADKRVGISKGTVQPLNGNIKNIATGVSCAVKNGIQPKSPTNAPKPNTPKAGISASIKSAPKTPSPRK